MVKEIAGVQTNLDKNLPNASARLGQIPQVTPEVMMIVYLDEIAGRQAELLEEFSKLTTDGELKSYVFNITDKPFLFVFIAKQITLHNNGTDAIYILPRKGKPSGGEASISRNGELSLDMNIRRSRKFWLVCDTGQTATVKIHTW